MLFRSQVLYDPQDPHRARAVKTVSDLFLAAKLLGGAGVALLAAGLLAGLIAGLLNNLPLRF